MREDLDDESTNLMPKEVIYADDVDIITKDEKVRDELVYKAEKVFSEMNLKVNSGKTEYTTLKRRNRLAESWRSVKKLGSLLGDSEDMCRRKQLSVAASKKLNKIWTRRHKIKLPLRIKIYKTMIKPVLLYNCGTCGITKAE